MSSSWSGKTVLIVEDSAEESKKLASIYQQLGLEVVGYASNGVEGIEKYQELSPDIVSLDIIMPEMHGIDCFRKLVQINPELRAVFVSCLAKESHLPGAFEGEISSHQFVVKPAKPEELVVALNAVYGELPAQEVEPLESDDLKIPEAPQDIPAEDP